jgi:hypothetical protein
VHTFLWSFHLQFSLEQRGHVSKVNLPLSSGELLDRMDEVHELYTKWGKRRKKLYKGEFPGKNCTRVNFLVCKVTYILQRGVLVDILKW